MNLTNFTKEEHQFPFSTYDTICIYTYKEYLKKHWVDTYDRNIKKTHNKKKNSPICLLLQLIITSFIYTF